MILTSPIPRRLVLSIQTPQLVYAVSVVVCKKNVQFVSNDGVFKTLSIQPASGFEIAVVRLILMLAKSA